MEQEAMMNQGMSQNPEMEMGQEQPMSPQGGEVEGVDVDTQIQQAMQLLQSDPEAAQEVIQRIQQSGLDNDMIEILGFMSTKAMETPSKYPILAQAIVAMIPELQQVITGELQSDGEFLSGLILAAVANEGGVI